MGRLSGAWLKSKLKFLKNMNCPDQARCFEILQLVLDEEADEAQRERFELQIKNCMPCYKRYNLDVAIKDVLKNKIEVKSVPEDLVDSIKFKIKNAT